MNTKEIAATTADRVRQILPNARVIDFITGYVSVVIEKGTDIDPYVMGDLRDAIPGIEVCSIDWSCDDVIVTFYCPMS